MLNKRLLPRIQQSDFVHWIIFHVAGRQRSPFDEGGRGNQTIGQLQPTTRGSLLETPGHFSNLERHGNGHERIEQCSSSGFFFRPHPDVEFCNRDDRTAGDEAVRHVLKKRPGCLPASEHVDEDIGVQHDLGHWMPRRLRRTDLRSERTNRRVPVDSSGCEPFCQAPKLLCNAFLNLIRLSSWRKASPTTLLCSPFGTVFFNSSSRSSGNVKFACLVELATIGLRQTIPRPI